MGIELIHFYVHKRSLETPAYKISNKQGPNGKMCSCSFSGLNLIEHHCSRSLVAIVLQPKCILRLLGSNVVFNPGYVNMIFPRTPTQHVIHIGSSSILTAPNS